MMMIASIRFQPTGKLYDFDASGFSDLQPGDFVIVETARGQQIGEIVSLEPATDPDKGSGLKPIIQPASGRELAIRQQWREKEREVLDTARQIVLQMNLPIKMVTAEYTFDGHRLTLLYTSEEKKLNLKNFQRRLRRRFSGRIDLRRIGARDQAKLMGGYGACGEPRCCARFLADFQPVSIKMAKLQGVSLNPSEITGLCGRLRCCLMYENEQYKEASANLPRRKRYVRTPHGDGKVVDLIPLRNIVVVQIEDRRVEVPAEEVEELPRK